MIEASPRDTLPKNLCPAPTSSSGPKVFGAGCRCGGGYCGGGGCCAGYCGGGGVCAETGTVQHINAASVTAARRETEIMKTYPWYRNSGRRLNLMPTSTALGCVLCPLDSDVIGTNYDGRTAGKIWLAPRNSLYCAARGRWHRCGRRLDGAGRNHRTAGCEPLFGPCDRGLRPCGLFHR